jgi:tetratricopeptide (TPR) repeat protein
MPHASGLSRVFYDPRLYADADDFVTSAAVRGRYEADPERYPAECAFYRLLDARGEVAARFAPRGAVTGPEIVIYRLGPAFRDTASARGALDPHWWTAAIPAEYRARARTLVALGGDTARSSLDSGSPAWIGTLAPFYAKYIQPFAVNMATELVTLGRNEAARDYARATLEMYPADLNASLVYATCSGRLKQWDEARVCTERALNRYRRGEAEPALVLLHARALANTGATREAAREIESLLPRLGPNDPIALSARELLARVAAPARPAPTPSVVGANE